VVGGRRTDADNEKLVTDLYKRNAKLTREGKALAEKAKQAALAVGKLKRELQLARRRGNGVARRRGEEGENLQDNLQDVTAASAGAGAGNAKLGSLVEKLRHRLINAEKQLGKLRDENSRLRGGKGAGAGGVGDETASAMAASR
jgi:chromosome segregation ATPase